MSSALDEGLFTDVTRLLYPKSIVVIGASDRPGNLGGDTVERLLRFEFPGPVWAVNPSGGTVRGIQCHRSVAELPGVPEFRDHGGAGGGHSGRGAGLRGARDISWRGLCRGDGGKRGGGGRAGAAACGALS